MTHPDNSALALKFQIHRLMTRFGLPMPVAKVVAELLSQGGGAR